MMISKRKRKHLQIALKRDVSFKNKKTGFEKYDLIHCALPEINFNDISTEIQFLGKTLAFPLMIGPMTGGCSTSLKMNRHLAEASEEMKIAIAVGSQRQMSENERYIESYKIVRRMNPDGVVIGNIGGTQLAAWKDPSPIQRMIDVIQADAMAVHLNPLQEVLQPEGDVDFKGVLMGIERLVGSIKIPVIVKEVGHGISDSVAEKLMNVGVSWIDVAGAGGTSWAAVEYFRTKRKETTQNFRYWGIPTAESIKMVRNIPKLKIIASGGIDSGITMAKAIALGADLCSAALPLLKVYHKKKKKGLLTHLSRMKIEFQTAMFLTGCSIVPDLHKNGVLKPLL